MHKIFAQANDVFAEDAIVENTEGPIDASKVRNRIYSGILQGTVTLQKTISTLSQKDIYFGAALKDKASGKAIKVYLELH